MSHQRFVFSLDITHPPALSFYHHPTYLSIHPTIPLKPQRHLPFPPLPPPPPPKNRPKLHLMFNPIISVAITFNSEYLSSKPPGEDAIFHEYKCEDIRQGEM